MSGGATNCESSLDRGADVDSGGSGTRLVEREARASRPHHGLGTPAVALSTDGPPSKPVATGRTKHAHLISCPTGASGAADFSVSGGSAAFDLDRGRRRSARHHRSPSGRVRGAGSDS